MFGTTTEISRIIKFDDKQVLEIKDVKFSANNVIGPKLFDFADELAAMANTSGGVFLLGIDEKLKIISGIPEDKLDIAQTWTETICIDRIQPKLPCRIRKIPITKFDGDEKIIIRIDVPKSLFVHLSPGGYFHRIGGSKRVMTPEVLARLFQQRSQTRIIRFDEQPITTAPSNCLEKSLWNKFKTVQSPKEDVEFLDKLKLLTRDDTGKDRPSVSGILMASNIPHEFLPNAYIQAVSYRGNERNAAYQIDAKDIVGPLDIQIMDAYKFITKNMHVFATKDPGRRDVPQYEMQAIFEALVNAVAHRDYSIYGSKIRLHMFSDRLEIISPGTIPNSMTIDSLPLRQSARNELLTSLLARCPLPTGINNQGNRNCFMDKRGEGVPIILSKSEELSGRVPVYRLIDDTELHLTIFSAQSP